MRRHAWQHVAILTAVGFTVIGASALSASAGITGPCSATLAGTNVGTFGTGATDKPIVVAHDASVPLVMSASGQLTHVKISLAFAGFSWVVKDKTVSTPVYRDTIPVKDYAAYGVGLYKVTGTGTGPGLVCNGSALVRVKGNPLTSVIGVGGLAAALIGGAGLLFGTFGGAGGFAPLRLLRTSLAGLVAGLGVLALLQEAAVIYPTLAVAVIGLAAGLGVGVVAGVAPMLGHAGTAGTHASGRPATPAA
ncbi:MAG: hypothetical protein WCH31_06040 [Actinomycetes bacterium]